MPNVNFTSKPVDRLLLNATIQDDRPLRTLFSPTHETEIERKGLHKALIRVAADNYSIDSDLLVCAVADSSQLGLRVLSFMEEGDEEGFFMLIGNPTGSSEAKKVAEKDVVFVLDTSGSMRGEKIEQSRAAVEYCLNHLNQGDRFNIVTFGTNVKGFRPGLVEKSKQNVKSGIEFIEEVVATGRTNISGALRTGLQGNARNSQILHEKRSSLSSARSSHSKTPASLPADVSWAVLTCLAASDTHCPQGRSCVMRASVPAVSTWN
jgi:hypothetical protein